MESKYPLTLIILMKKPVSLAVVAGILVSALNFGVAQAATTFTDVPNSNPYFGAIEWLTQNGVIQGYGDGTFRPNNPVNRAEMLKMIFLADGNEKNADAAMATAQLFPDTSSSAWYARYVALARQRGTVQGYPDGTFRPANNINKAEAYKIVLKEFYNETTMQYALTHASLPNTGAVAPDVKKTDWFVMFINFAAIKNFYDAGSWTYTTNGNHFYPGQNLTRGQLAQLIYRAKAVSDNFPNNIEDTSSLYGSSIIPFNTSLYSYTFGESSGTPNFAVNDAAHPNTVINYATKYPQSLLVSNGDTANTLKFFAGANHNILDISVEVKENANGLSIQKFFEQNAATNLYTLSKSHEDLLINALPAVWFHKVNWTTTNIDEVVVIQFANAIAIITDHGSKHQADGVFNYMVRNFWFKNLSV